MMPSTFDTAVALPANGKVDLGPYSGRTNSTSSIAEKIDVIYIMGCGRSGSTLLAMMLGSLPQVVSLGEVLYHHRWLKNNFTCTCGALFDSCDFWQAVTGKLRSFESETGVTPTPGGWAQARACWQLLAGRRLPSREQAQDYALATYRLFKAVQEVSRKPVILDSSKHPMRLLYLYASGFFNLKIIHLIRDGRAYLNSTRRPVQMPAKSGQVGPAQSAWRATLRWLLTNSFSSILCSRLPQENACTLKYEDFARDPCTAMQSLHEFLHLDFHPELLKGEKPVAHNISGSRWRYQTDRAIRLDEKWRTELPAGRRLIFAILAGWWNRKQGYR